MNDNDLKSNLEALAALYKAAARRTAEPIVFDDAEHADSDTND